MPILNILRGIPASGKSTMGKILAINPKTLRINRDDIRAMMGYSFDNFDKNIEEIINIMQDNMIREALTKGYNVIVDNLNLKQSYVNDLNRIAEEIGDVTVEEHHFKVDLDVAINRNKMRGNTVPEEVITKLFNNFKKIKIAEPKYYPAKEYKPIEQDDSLPHAVICDLDGTLALFDRNKKNPYDRDFENDKVNEAVQTILFDYLLIPIEIAEGRTIIFTSGRSDKFREVTLDWLDRCGFDVYIKEFGPQLLMRKEGDQRKDSIVKQEMYDNYIKGKYYVDFVLDDRNQVVDMWRKNGLTCLQVAEGRF